jgi:PncC family amidohydrolase
MYKLAEKLVYVAFSKGIMITTAESCTGGMVASAITSVSGSSHVFDRGFITYSYESKSEVLGVDPSMIKNLGAVSSEVAASMAIGALERSNADIAISITGIAGPTGATETKQVGLVYFAIYKDNKIHNFEKQFKGDRDSVRHSASYFALEKLLEFIR